MAVYRLHRKEWDRGFPPPPGVTSSSKKRKASSVETDGNDEGDSIGAAAPTPIHVKNKDKRKVPSNRTLKIIEKSFPGGGRKGVSSGLSTIIKRRDGRDETASVKQMEKARRNKTEWWKELNSPTSGAKGSMTLKVG